MTAIDLPARPANPPGSVRLVQLLLVAPLGLATAFGAVLFTVIDPVERLAAADWVVACVAVGLGGSSAAIGVRLGRGGARIARAAGTLIGAQLAFSVMKLVAYQEAAALVFLALELLALGLLRSPAARDFLGRR